MLFELPKGTKLRHEWKHIISPSDQAQLIARLCTFCAPDPHYGAQSYHIRSLYFDNVYDKALRERLNGQECREKFRIRYYNFDDSYIVLEKKSKFKDLCGKQSGIDASVDCNSSYGDTSGHLYCGQKGFNAA